VGTPSNRTLTWHPQSGSVSTTMESLERGTISHVLGAKVEVSGSLWKAFVAMKPSTETTAHDARKSPKERYILKYRIIMDARKQNATVADSQQIP